MHFISGGQSFNLYSGVVHFFNTSVNETSVSAQDNSLHALVYKCVILSIDATV
jgi:hypothetical protein